MREIQEFNYNTTLLAAVDHTHTQAQCILYAQPHEHMNTEEPDDDDNNNNKNNNKYAQYAAATQ